MLINYSLKQLGNHWEFDKESDFEDFLWTHLEQLLNIKPFQRQYYVKGQFCDILGIGQNKELIIIELKVSEDRYIVQQLTRYYDALLDEKPFAADIDYSKKIKLLAILPSIHKDSLIDAKYSILEIQFMSFSLEEDNEKIYFKLNDYATDISSPVIQIPYQDQSHNLELPELPKKLKQMMIKASEVEQIGISTIRKQLLSFHKKISEKVVSESIIYQFNKTSPVAELRFDNKRNQIALFLWLPLSTARRMSRKTRRTILRMRIWTDWKTVSYLGYIPDDKNNGIMITAEEFQEFPTNMIPAALLPPKKQASRRLPSSVCKRELFDNDLEFRKRYITSIIHSTIQQRKNIHAHKYEELLALTNNDYIRLLINIKKITADKKGIILSQVMDLDNPDFSLNKFIELALTERFLSLNKSR